MQTLPIYRIRDGYEKLLRNKETFRICFELLKNENEPVKKNNAVARIDKK